MQIQPLRIVLMMDTNRAYERGLLRGILKYSRLHGPLSFWRKQRVVSGGPQEMTLDMIKAWKPDGIIWREGYGNIDVKSLGLPVVYAPYTEPDPELLNIVSGDDGIGTMAADHLLTRGFRNFAYYGQSDNCYFSRGRKEAFASTVAKAGFDVACCDRDEKRDLSTWLADLPSPLGLMVSTDDSAVDCYHAARESGRSIPEDLAIVGVGNDELVCDFANPPLSSVQMSTEQAGYTAARSLVESINGRGPGADVVCAALHVVERQSTNILAIEDKAVAQAMRLIQTHADMNLHVDDLVKVLPLSRRALYKRFSRALGRSVYEEIRRARMDYAARMLKETDLPIADVAEKLGFPDAKNLARVFRKEKGVTPYKYRMRYSPYN